MLLGVILALVEFDEHVLVARHQHLVATGLLELVAKHQAEGQHHVLLDDAVLLRARVVPTVAGIDDDDRLEGAGRQLVRTQGRHRQRRLHVERAERRQRGCLERLARGLRRSNRHDVERQTMPLAVLGRHNVSALDHHRPDHLDHDTRLAAARAAGVEGADEADRDVLLRLRGKLERGFGDVDNHAVGVREREDAELDLLGKADQKAGMGDVTAERGLRGRLGRDLGFGGSGRAGSFYGLLGFLGRRGDFLGSRLCAVRSGCGKREGKRQERTDGLQRKAPHQSNRHRCVTPVYATLSFGGTVIK